MNQADTLQKMMQRPGGTRRPGGWPGPDEPGKAPAQAVPRVICVTSGKGGVGKTNVVTNLAFAMTRLGKRVLILDADLNLANVDILLGLTPRFNLHHVLTGEKSLADILVEGPGGMHILPASSGILELASLTESQKLFFMSEMEALGPRVDIMLIDTGAGINDNVVYFNLAARERVVLLTPEPTSLTDAYALIKVLSSRHDVKRFRILINHCRDEKEAVAVFRKLSIVADRFLASLSLDFLGHIPYDEKLPKAVRAQRLVGELYPGSPASRTFSRLAAQIAAEEPERSADGNIKFFWQGLLDR
jgi:flagellar biosynthesis protein FlhG